MNNLGSKRASDSDIQQIIDSTEKGTTMFVPADVYYLIAKELLALREAGKEPVAWRYRTTDIKGNPKPDWSFYETESLLGLYQPLYAAPQLPAVPDGWSESASANAITVMLDRIETIDPADDDRIEEIKGLVRILVAMKIPVVPNEHVRREVNAGGNTWVQCSKKTYEKHKADGKHVRELYERPQTIATAPQNPQQNIPEIIPEGWVMVPIEPTDEMTEAMYRHHITPRNALKAAIAAAPKPEVIPETFEQWLAKQTDGIDVDCGCVTTEAFYHWLRQAYSANR